PSPSPAPVGPPLPVEPYPGPGAWKTDVAYIARYQNALTWLAQSLGHPDWDPGGVDGKYGVHTANAVKAFQYAQGLRPVDWQAGPDTAAALDAALGMGGDHTQPTA